MEAIIRQAPVIQSSLQCWHGMVTNNGRPAERSLPDVVPPLSPDADELWHRMATRAPPKLRANLAASTDAAMTPNELRRYLERHKRLDVEQAVAMVLSALPQSAAAQLYPHMAHLLATTCMWRQPSHEEVPETSRKAARARRIEQIRGILASENCSLVVPSDSAECDLVAALMRVRRYRPGMGNSQRLRLPLELLEAVAGTAGAAADGDWCEHFRWGRQMPVPEPVDGCKVVPKLLFGRLTAALDRMAGDQSAGAQLNREVEALEEEIETGGGRLEALRTTRDIYALAFSFLARQRHLQVKVVSDEGWTTFLAKGESSQVLQNRPDMLTGFELALLELALSQPEREIDWAALTAVCTPPGCAAHAAADGARRLQLLDRTCLAMGQYVEVHGGGSFEALTLKQDVSGGSGRGPVNTYNKLVDLLRELQKRCAAAGTPVQISKNCKFLAKDIMSWNDAWKDDAFAGGKIPGWVGWLQQRQAAGSTGSGSGAKGSAVV